ncbi:MAG: hypothetical protein JO345_30360 [Streptosporangiaceae bacterium]|nr:hypothetical protein [Streptosporangiaceae bacterium]
MARLTPEEEAAYALDWGLARDDLDPVAQLAYDRLRKERETRPPAHTASGGETGPPPVRYLSVPRRLTARSAGLFAICVIGLVIGPYGDAHHIAVLSDLGIVMVGGGFGLGLITVIGALRAGHRARKFRREAIRMLLDKD